jgi:hypothetical protein
MELTKSKFENKFEQIKGSIFWKWAYIALVAIMSVGYFAFSYQYFQEAQHISLGGSNFEVKSKYTTVIMISVVLIYVFSIFPIIFKITSSDRFFYSFVTFFAWCILAILPYFIFYGLGL